MSRDFPIVDAHQHFWEPEVNDHPWLRDEPPIAFRYGDYATLKRRYLPADYFADARRWNVVRTAYVEAEWDPRDAVGEMRYVERLRRATGWPGAALKVSGLGRPGRPWTAEANREIVLTALELFGIERSMFASNFPVDGLCAGFDHIVLGCREILRGLAPREQRQFFHDNAMRIYEME